MKKDNKEEEEEEEIELNLKRCDKCHRLITQEESTILILIMKRNVVKKVMETCINCCREITAKDMQNFILKYDSKK